MNLKTTLVMQSYFTASWLDDKIVDWSSGGKCYTLDGQINQFGKYHYGKTFDRAINSDDGKYAFLYKLLGTKGVLIKNGEILREINRSFYHSDVYEYPAAFLTFKGKTYLVHCPREYCRLEFEDVETGKLVTDMPARKPADVFHSRLEISPNCKYLLSKGWIWHPLNVVQAYNISDCFKNPLLLDVLNWNNPKVGTEICTASFINDSEVLIGSSEDEIVNEDFIEILPQKSMAIWNLKSNKISKPITLEFKFGNLVAINDRYTWDICDFPKVINVHTGEIVLKEEHIQTGNQCSSIIYDTSNFKQVVFNKPKTKLAILDKSDSFSVVSLE